MRKLLALLLFLFPVAGNAQVQDISPGTKQYLGAIADTATIEHVLCLLAVPDGSVDSLGHIGSTIDLTIEPPQEADAEKAIFAPCPIGTVIQWHNHILASTLKALKELSIVPPPEVKGAWQACVLSLNDYDETLRMAAPITMIQVTSDVFCWWTQDEVRKLPRAFVNWPQHKIAAMGMP